MKAINITILYGLAMLFFGYAFTRLYEGGYIDVGTYTWVVALMFVSLLIVFLFARELEENDEFRRKIIYMLSKLRLGRKPKHTPH